MKKSDVSSAHPVSISSRETLLQVALSPDFALRGGCYHVRLMPPALLPARTRKRSHMATSSPQPSIIGFDGDDTLWHNESIFSITQEKFRQLLSPYADDQRLMDALL